MKRLTRQDYQRAHTINAAIQDRDNGQGSYKQALQQAYNERKFSTPLAKQWSRK